ncbi:hypothetical protein UlMin_007403 [Ulmus minor]
MGAEEPVVERKGEMREENGKREEEEEEEEGGVKDVEKKEVGLEEHVVESRNLEDFPVSMMQRLNPSNPLRIVINSGTRPSITTLNSRDYTNKISLFLFLLHMIVAVGLVGFLLFKGVQGLIQVSDNVKRKEKNFCIFLKHYSCIMWQKAVRVWPKFMVPFILWSSFLMSLSAGILLICFQKPPTDGVGVCFIAFAIGNGLYACWILVKSLDPVSKFRDLNQSIYWMIGVGFMWMSLWILAVLGALNFYFPPLIIILLIVSLAWTAEVMRNVANIRVSRVIALYFLRGMQSNTQFCFQRASTKNLGSAFLGSLLVPAIEALRVVAWALNLLEGEDEFMFSCAHCCLRVVVSIFRYGNRWAYVQPYKICYHKNYLHKRE